MIPFDGVWEKAVGEIGEAKSLREEVRWMTYAAFSIDKDLWQSKSLTPCADERC